MNLDEYTDEALLSDVRRLIGAQRELTARLVLYLEEVERRRLHLLAGFSSMFEFCVKELRMSEGEAFRRLTAARLGRRFPIIHSLIASGEVHLSALVLLRPHLNELNHAELLEAVRGKSKREVEILLAARFPRRDEPARVRAVAPERFRVEFTANAELCEKLERCLDLSSHANPKRDLAFVIERAVELLLRRLERKCLAKIRRARPQVEVIRARDDSQGGDLRADRSADRAPAFQHITNADRRFVFERDGSRCTYLSPDGRRCEATAFLELDHVIPRGHGGGNARENLRVFCRAHNLLWAEQVFGRARVERAVHLRQRKRALQTASYSFDVREKVVIALNEMGFALAQSRSAVRAAEKRLCVQGAAPSPCERLEQRDTHAHEALLREALHEAMKAA
jgi:hypothetical protein